MKKTMFMFVLLVSAFQLANAANPSKVLVVNTMDASLSVVDLEEKRELTKIKVGEKPYGVAVSEEQGLIAVGVEGEEVVKFFDAKGYKPVGQVKIGKMKNDHIALTPDGKYFLVANYYSDSVIAIDVKKKTRAFQISGLSAPHVIKFGPLKDKAYVTCKKTTGIGIVDLKTRKAQFHPLNVNPRSLTFAPDESKVYFGSFWVDGFFEMDTETGKVTKLLQLPTESGKTLPQEVTYHGVEAVKENVILAANEGRSYLDAVESKSGRSLDRLSSVSRPCCVEKIPSDVDSESVRALVSNLGDSTLEIVELSEKGELSSLARIKVGEGPKRVAFLK